MLKKKKSLIAMFVLVPFYRGAVVFLTESEIKAIDERFSSPFIEERLYLMMIIITESHSINGSRPLLSRSGCILKRTKNVFVNKDGSRPLLSRSGCI